MSLYTDMDIMKLIHRTKLPRCQYGVYSPSIENGDVDECGDPAIAVWNWGSGDLYVCEKHDDQVSMEEYDRIEEERRESQLGKF